MQNPEDFIRHELGKIFVVNPNSIRPLTQYLGNKVSYVTLENVQSAWIFSSSQYIPYAVKNVINTLAQEARTLPKHGKYPWNSNFIPETDTSHELPPPRYAYYQYLIGVLQWITEIVRVDIMMETSAIASIMAIPRKGHLEQLLRIIAYLRIQHNSSMIFYPTEPDIDEYQFICENWLASTYSEFKEELPTNAPQPKLIGFTMRAFIDSNHAGELTTHQSRT